jgi:hypothetical protein
MSDSSDAVVRTGSAELEKKPSPEVVKGEPQPVARSMAEIESDMEATRARLAQTLDELKVATQPKNIVNRQVQKVKDYYTDDYGGLRVDRVVVTAGVVVGTIVVIKTWRRITR